MWRHEGGDQWPLDAELGLQEPCQKGLALLLWNQLHHAAAFTRAVTPNALAHLPARLNHALQAIGLLDDLDKELNTYAMRVREWYGWHFPEMTKIVSDNIAYAKTGEGTGGWQAGGRLRQHAIEESAGGRQLCKSLHVAAGWLFGARASVAQRQRTLDHTAHCAAHHLLLYLQ